MPLGKYVTRDCAFFGPGLEADVFIINNLVAWHVSCKRFNGMSDFSSVDGVLAYFRNLWKDSTPPAKLFKTSKSGYLYDTGTNKILSCNIAVFNLLSALLSSSDRAVSELQARHSNQELIDAAIEIKRGIDKEAILLMKKPTRFGLSSHYRDLEELTKRALGMIQLELTEQCNLRCEYCIYNSRVEDKREHGYRHMNREIALRAINYLSEHSSSKEELGISFYGGEPLLRFDLIKDCVEYAHIKIPNKQITFSVTTNGTLLNRNISEYFLKNNFSVVVSLDGPESVHDSYRKDEKGNGSYHKTMKGLLGLIEIFKNDVSRIALSMVYAPPYSEAKLASIADMWSKSPYLSEDINVLITYAHENSIPPEKRDPGHFDLSLEKWARTNFWDAYIKGYRANPIARSILEKRLARLFKRPVYNSPSDKFHLNGCCLPGVRKIFLSIDGSFHLCERIADDSPQPGYVQAGIDFDTIKNVYVDEYDMKSLPMCANCWAIQLCSVCYTSAFRRGKFDVEKKNRACALERLSKELELSYFCQLLEENSSGLDYLSNWILT